MVNEKRDNEEHRLTPVFCPYCGSKDIETIYRKTSVSSPGPEGNLFPIIFSGHDIYCSNCEKLPYRVQGIDITQIGKYIVDGKWAKLKKNLQKGTEKSEEMERLRQIFSNRDWVKRTKELLKREKELKKRLNYLTD